METTALILITIALILLLLIVGLLAILIFRMSKQSLQTQTVQTEQQVQPNQVVNMVGQESNKSFHPAIVQRIKEAEHIRHKKSDLFCPNHPEEAGEVMCAVCDHLYCKACIKAFKTLHFCKEHITLLMNKEWEEVITIKTSPNDPERGVKLFELKKEIFQSEDIPTYIETHYKINVDHDDIETYLVLYSLKEEINKVRQKLSTFTLN
jgi:hypothetical protein